MTNLPRKPSRINFEEIDSRQIERLPGSPLALMLAAARAEGIATPQIKLQEAATAGNIDAIKELQKIQARNRFNELVNYLDDDEFTP